MKYKEELYSGFYASPGGVGGDQFLITITKKGITYNCCKKSAKIGDEALLEIFDKFDIKVYTCMKCLDRHIKENFVNPERKLV